ncbi:MAG TPA: SGNH/GDSL hydrolase family protein [Solirubrobacterales bacterium]|nr:SGNH/GDSL hydrolase family protein [Solirubrobacterales bacterium]
MVLGQTKRGKPVAAVVAVAAMLVAAGVGCGAGGGETSDDTGGAGGERAASTNGGGDAAASTNSVGARAGEAGGSRAGGANTAWRRAPIVPRFTPRSGKGLARAVARSVRTGMRGGVFAKVGDSNSDYPGQFFGLGCRPAELGPHRYLAPTLRRYRSVRLGNLSTYPGCRPPNSFSRDSAAAESNATSEWTITPTEGIGPRFLALAPTECPGRLTPVQCEIELIKPRYITVMIGSGDALFGDPLGKAYAENLRTLIGQIRARGPVPILSTLPPMTAPVDGIPGRIASINRTIHVVARRLRVPMINLWRALDQPRMVNKGHSPDGIHISVYGGDHSPRVLTNAANLTPEATRYGANRRHVVWLQTLRRLDRTAAVHGL